MTSNHTDKPNVKRTASKPPRVSVVIATYDRPEMLEHCLQAVQRQTVTDWEALVIGDCCQPSTREVIEAFEDPRITYANLPARCGEQSIPNSVGLALARASVVAFLNHDDYWLPDHLEIGLARLAETGADLCTTSAVFATYASHKSYDVVLAESSPSWRRLQDVFGGPFFLFEPISSWLVRRDRVLQLSPIGPALAVARTPITDWLLRFWRAGLKHCNEERITVIKDNIRKQTKTPHYRQSSPMFPFIEALAAGKNPEGLREEISIRQAAHLANGGRVRDFKVFNKPLALGVLPEGWNVEFTDDDARVFLETGKDPYEEAARAAGLPLGSVLRAALTNRTGETMHSQPTFEEMVQAARLQLSNQTQ